MCVTYTTMYYLNSVSQSLLRRQADNEQGVQEKIPPVFRGRMNTFKEQIPAGNGRYRERRRVLSTFLLTASRLDIRIITIMIGRLFSRTLATGAVQTIGGPVDTIWMAGKGVMALLFHNQYCHKKLIIELIRCFIRLPYSTPKKEPGMWNGIKALLGKRGPSPI